MKSSYYRYCIVPQCKSTTIKTPNKLFIHVSNKKQIRRKWLEIARRQDALLLSTSSTMYFCEDHFDLPNDMVNYIQYRVMGSVSQVRMKPGCIPTRFECQSDQRKRTSNTIERPYIQKKRRKILIEESEKDLEERSTITKPLELGETSTESKADPEPVADDEQAEVEDEASKVCRTCLAPGVRMCDVAAGGLQDTFEQVTGTELYTSDARPTQVCFWCSSQLQRFRAFCQMSGEAEAFMTTLIMQGLQITERKVSERHRLIKPTLLVKNNPLIAIHTQEDPDECVTVEVKIEVENEVEDKNRSGSETESEIEIGTEVKTGMYMTESENEMEDRQTDWEAEGEIKIEIDEMDIKEFDPFEAIENASASDDTYYCLQCAEAFTSQCDLLKHVQSHTDNKRKQKNTTRQNVKAKRTKRKVRPNVESHCKFCNERFAIKTQLVSHVATEHSFNKISQTQKPKRRKTNS